jgi:hypothetical protein
MQKTGPRITWNNCSLSISIGKRFVVSIESQCADSLLFIGAVACKTVVGQNRSNIAIEIDRSDFIRTSDFIEAFVFRAHCPCRQQSQQQMACHKCEVDSL